MDERTPQQDAPEQSEYEAPELTELGTVAELTRANEPTLVDAAG